MPRPLVAGAALLLVMLTAAGRAHTEQNPPTPFRAATRLVQVSVVVHDRDRQPVTGLTLADFKLFEEGKEQAIELFSVEGDRPRRSETAGTAPAGTFSNR